MAEETREIQASQSSCEISVNAKGQYSGKVKAYADTIDLAFTLAERYAEKLEKIVEQKNA